jgi:hypothetical protein
MGMLSTFWTDFWRIFGLNPPQPTSTTAAPAAAVSTSAGSTAATVTAAPVATTTTTSATVSSTSDALPGAPTLAQVAAALNTLVSAGTVGLTTSTDPLVQQFQNAYNAQLPSGQPTLQTTGNFDAATQSALTSSVTASQTGQTSS